MASGPFDMQKLFKTSNPPPSSSSSSNPPSPFPPSYSPPPASYPPPTFSYPSSQANPPFHQQQQQHHQFLPYDQLANMHLHQQQQQRPMPSYPTPPLQQQQQQQPSNHGARLMALLGTNPPPNPEFQPPQTLQSPPPTLPTSGSVEFSIPVATPFPSAPPGNLAIPQPSPLRMPSSKLPKGRRLIGDHVVYDVDVRFHGEVQPQLEVTPITKYNSDPGLVLGRQIAVNRSYICYGLKLGAIRILNINTALRALLRGHTQRVTDMAFFAEDVHLLASASVDGRVFVWKIDEGIDEEDKPQITGKTILAIEIEGDEESVHPRVCWYSHKQEVLIVGIGKRVLKIDTTKVGKGEVFSAEEPLKCPVDKLIDGVQLVGKHEGEVIDLSMCQWMMTRLVSASSDGTVKIWEDCKASPLAVLRPHDGQPVNSVKFLAAPHCPEHIILITAGRLNREVKIWASASEEGWLLPSDAESWTCIQTLDLKSSSEARNGEAFFNQVVALPSAGLILLANAKKNAIYAVHIEYGSCPAATHMDYIAEFTVTMPILSITGTSDSLPGGDHVIQVYCVQTQAIQQYALDLSQCLPPPLENMGLEKTDSTASRNFEVPSSGVAMSETSLGSTTPKQPITSENASTAGYPVSSGAIEVPNLHEKGISETKQNILPSVVSDAAIPVVSSTPPLSPRLSGRSSGFRTPSASFEPSSPLGNRGAIDQQFLDYSVGVPSSFPDITSIDDESRKAANKNLQNDISMVPNAPLMFKHPTHLITPSEILSKAVSSSENTQVKDGEPKIQDVVVNNDVKSAEVEVKVVGETGTRQRDVDYQMEPRNLIAEKKEKSFYSQASDLNVEVARESCVHSPDSLSTQGNHQTSDSGVTQALGHSPSVGEEEYQDSLKGASGKLSEEAPSAAVAQTPTKPTRGQRKGKQSQLSGSSPSPRTLNSADDSSTETGCTTNSPSTEAALSQIQAMHETVNQLMNMQKEMQKQMSSLVTGPVNKEGKRIEAALGRSMEKSIKANSDAVWARLQEEYAKNEKLERDRTQQITSLITNTMNKELPAMLERTLKKELGAVGQAVARVVTPAVEKSVSSSITESFQKGVGDKVVNQLEKSVSSKLEAIVARQIQSQFQTSVKQALQDVLRSSLEASVIPAFEMSCKAMFEQVNAAFQKGMIEHTTAAQQQFESAQSPLAHALRDAISSASSITRTLSGELADGQRKILALAAAGANSKAANPLATQPSNGALGSFEMVEVPLDPTKELSRLVAEHKFEEAFTGALQKSDVSIVSWLCSKVDLQKILSTVPLPLSQGVLLALIQQLACDISHETSLKLTWMTDVAVAINPADPIIAMHVRPIFEQVYQILGHHRTLPTTSAADASSTRLVMHVINSVLTSCK